MAGARRSDPTGPRRQDHTTPETRPPPPERPESGPPRNTHPASALLVVDVVRRVHDSGMRRPFLTTSVNIGVVRDGSPKGRVPSLPALPSCPPSASTYAHSDLERGDL